MAAYAFVRAIAIVSAVAMSAVTGPAADGKLVVCLFCCLPCI